MADCKGKSDVSAAIFWPLYRKTEEAYRQILAENDPVSIRDLAVDGNDLIASGLKPGKAIGQILSEMLEDVLNDPSHNTKEYLLSRYLPGEIE